MSARICPCGSLAEGRALCAPCSRRAFTALRAAVEEEPPTMEALWLELGKCRWCGASEPCGYSDGDCDGRAE